MKYYFITYKGKIRSELGNYSIWNQCINCSPMEFIKIIEKSEQKGSDNYFDFVVINTLEITKEEFDKYDGHF